MSLEEKVINGPSFSHWLEPNFPINFFYDLSNYLVLSFFLFLLLKYKTKFNYKQKILFIILMSSPFFFNGLLIDWRLFPDQSKYISSARFFRIIFFDYQNVAEYFADSKNLKVKVASFFYSLFPFINFETYKSIGFINRFLYLLMIIFLSAKTNISLTLKLFLIFSPSLSLYSSLSLRETLILVTMVLLTYFLINKNYFKTFLLTSLLIFIKAQNLIIIYLPFVLNKLFNRSTKIVYSFSISIVVILLLFSNLDYIFSYINKVSLGFFSETYGEYKSTNSLEHYVQIDLKNFLPIISGYMLRFILSPFPNISSIYELIIFFENFFIYFLIYKTFIFKYFEKSTSEKKFIYYWLLSLFLAIMMYSIVSFNDGTIHRYKILILSYILIAYNFILFEKKNSK